MNAPPEASAASLSAYLCLPHAGPCPSRASPADITSVVSQPGSWMQRAGPHDSGKTSLGVSLPPPTLAAVGHSLIHADHAWWIPSPSTETIVSSGPCHLNWCRDGVL